MLHWRSIGKMFQPVTELCFVTDEDLRCWEVLPTDLQWYINANYCEFISHAVAMSFYHIIYHIMKQKHSNSKIFHTIEGVIYKHSCIREGSLPVLGLQVSWGSPQCRPWAVHQSAGAGRWWCIWTLSPRYCGRMQQGWSGSPVVGRRGKHPYPNIPTYKQEPEEGEGRLPLTESSPVIMDLHILSYVL